MPITVRCISCGKVAQVKDQLAGKKVKCTCGAVIAVPAAAQPKACAGCGVDVTKTKRTKDPIGKYYCAICWQTRQEAATVGAAAKADADVVYYPCYVCEKLCVANEVYDAGHGQTVCKQCWKAGKRPASADGSPAGGDHAQASGSDDDLFCEACGNAFPPAQLTMGPEGAVLCKKCLKTAQRV
jgi:hypothetical protein